MSALLDFSFFISSQALKFPSSFPRWLLQSFYQSFFLYEKERDLILLFLSRFSHSRSRIEHVLTPPAWNRTFLRLVTSTIKRRLKFEYCVEWNFRFVFTSLITCWVYEEAGGCSCECMSTFNLFVCESSVMIMRDNRNYNKNFDIQQQLQKKEKKTTIIRLHQHNVKVQRCNDFSSILTSVKLYWTWWNTHLIAHRFCRMPFNKLIPHRVEKHHEWKRLDNFSSIWKYLFFMMSILSWKNTVLDFYWAATASSKMGRTHHSKHEWLFLSLSVSRAKLVKVPQRKLARSSGWHIEWRQHLWCGSTASNKC